MDPGTDRLTPSSHEHATPRFRFGIRDLFYAMALIGFLLGLWQASPELGYFWSILTVPTVIGIRLRLRGISLSSCLWWVFLTAVVASAAILAAGSAWATFHNGAVGIVVGDGFRSTMAAGLIGGVVGGFLSVFPLSIVLLAEPGISEFCERRTPEQASKLCRSPEDDPDVDANPDDSISAGRD